MSETSPSTSVAERVVTHPGRIIRGIPAFAFAMPEGWVIDESPGALFAMRLPTQENGFWVNALLTHDKVARSVDFDQAAKVTWGKLQRTTTDLVERGERLVRFGRQIMYVRGCEFTAKDGGQTLAQLHALWFAPVDEGGKVVDFFQLVLTCPVTTMPQHSKAILAMLSTFRFT